MTSKITEYESPTRFVDQQTRGPFARLLTTRNAWLKRELERG